MIIAQGRMDHPCHQGASSPYDGLEEGVIIRTRGTGEDPMAEV